MLDQSVKVNMNTPATGIIQKSGAKSFFVNCHQNSNLADSLFSSKPRYNSRPISVLQVMLMNNGYVLIEMMFEESGA